MHKKVIKRWIIGNAVSATELAAAGGGDGDCAPECVRISTLSLNLAVMLRRRECDVVRKPYLLCVLRRLSDRRATTWGARRPGALGGLLAQEALSRAIPAAWQRRNEQMSNARLRTPAPPPHQPRQGPPASWYDNFLVDTWIVKEQGRWSMGRACARAQSASTPGKSTAVASRWVGRTDLLPMPLTAIILLGIGAVGRFGVVHHRIAAFVIRHWAQSPRSRMVIRLAPRTLATTRTARQL